MVDQGLSERRSLAVAGMSANAYRYATRPDRNVEVQQRILALAQRHKRYGVGMIHLKLRQAGLRVNYKRVERLYQEAKLQVRRRKRKKVPVAKRGSLKPNLPLPQRRTDELRVVVACVRGAWTAANAGCLFSMCKT